MLSLTGNNSVTAPLARQKNSAGVIGSDNAMEIFNQIGEAESPITLPLALSDKVVELVKIKVPSRASKCVTCLPPEHRASPTAMRPE
jgi:hypothetical protein